MKKKLLLAISVIFTLGIAVVVVFIGLNATTGSLSPEVGQKHELKLAIEVAADTGIEREYTKDEISAYLIDRGELGQKYFLMSIIDDAISGNQMSLKTGEVYSADVGESDLPESITFSKGCLYILEGVRNNSDYEEAYIWWRAYNTTAGEISTKSYYYLEGGPDFNHYYDDKCDNDIERQIASIWTTDFAPIVNACCDPIGSFDWSSVGSNIIFIPSQDITLNLNLSQTLKYPDTQLFCLESNLRWEAPVKDLQAPVVNVPATYVVNVDNMESLDNILTQHVKVTDETDPNPQLIVRSSSYDANNRVCGTFPVTIYAQDAAGNTSADLTFNVLVADATSPSITVKTGLTVSNNVPELMSDAQFIDALFEISDNYDSFSDLRIDFNRGDYDKTYHVAGTKEVSIEVYDRAGNFADAFATFTVLDTTPPTITAESKEISNDHFGFIYEHNLPTLFTVTDDTSAVDKITKTIVENTYSSNWSKPGTYQVTCEAQDEAGNTNRATSTITVYDAVPPEASVKAITVSYTHQLSDEEILANVTATDDHVTPTITLDRAAYDENYAKVGTYKINVSVTDGRNVVTKELPVTVIDDVAPVIVGPSVITVGNSTKLSIEELKSKFNVTDAIDGEIDFTIEDLNGYADSYTKVNEYDFKITATDKAGNTNTFTFSLDVTDNTSPQILFDQYYIVLQEGEELTDEMIKSYASKVFNVSLASILSIDGEYNVEAVGTYSLRVALDDGTTRSLTVSVSPNENKSNDPVGDDAKPETKFWNFDGYADNIFNFKNWSNWTFWIWATWVVAGLIVLACVYKGLFGKKGKKRR